MLNPLVDSQCQIYIHSIEEIENLNYTYIDPQCQKCSSVTTERNSKNILNLINPSQTHLSAPYDVNARHERLLLPIVVNIEGDYLEFDLFQ